MKRQFEVNQEMGQDRTDQIIGPSLEGWLKQSTRLRRKILQIRRMKLLKGHNSNKNYEIHSVCKEGNTLDALLLIPFISA